MKSFKYFRLIFFIGCLFLYSDLVFSQDNFSFSHLQRDGHLKLYSYHTNEFIEVVYVKNGHWDDQVHDKLNHVLRSRGDDLTTKIDKRLIGLADHLQDHFQVDVIEVISGYRSPDFNKQLKDTGHQVANESYRTKGMAMDIHIDEIDESHIRDYLLSLGLGGVGYYGDKLMVHMDFGSVREWQGGSFKQNTNIGVFQKQSQIKIGSDKLFYDKSDRIQLSYQGLKTGDHLVLQKFVRGQWLDTSFGFEIEDLNKISLDVRTLLNGVKTSSVFGKFRFRVQKNADWQNSNEFYIKKS